MSRTARCTGGAIYGPTADARFFFRSLAFSGMGVRLALDDLGDRARDRGRLLLAHCVTGVRNLLIDVARRAAGQRVEGATAIRRRRDAILRADQDRRRHL